jgi:hypothetical protein
MNHDNKIVMYGMSSVGKTYFAGKLVDHDYYSFEAMFDRHGIETMGLSTSANLRTIANRCKGYRYVLDGWHLYDKNGAYLPKDSVVYVVFADYHKIIQQYPTPTDHLFLFKKWYTPLKFPRVRYWENAGRFIERSPAAYQAFLERQKVEIGIQ